MTRRAVEALVWAAIAYGIWLISLSAISGQEYLVGALCAVPCGLAATGARWAAEARWTLRPAWLLPAAALPLAVVTDAAQVLTAPWRRAEGRFHHVLTPAAGESPVPASRRAVTVALVSVTPGSYVLDVDPETGEMLVHSLAPRGPRLERLATG